MQMPASWLADLVLIAHFAFVLFVVGALGAIWIGAVAGWRWVRNYWFRALHLVAICIVAAESIFGIACPLTTLEDALRRTSPRIGFVAQWVQRLLYYSLPEWVFTAAYIAFALAVAATWWWITPQRSRTPRITRRSPLPR